ncbi:MAG: hypothetical protein JSU61_04825 [Fidelibacterota bacterium]|nr:MAG: hypothetical protein JSU61_04825 [Candidatus Neomarinimicrobiota bacterium]
MARTVFPLSWVISIIVIFGGYLLFGRILESAASEFTDAPLVLPGIGAVAGFFLSIGLGFLNAIISTILALLTVVVYNFLASLGGGFSVTMSEEPGAIAHVGHAKGEQEADAEMRSQA